jgi:hypothetical protein
MHLWAEACNTEVYVQNRCPHRVLGMSTPKEAFTVRNLMFIILRFLVHLFMCM